MRVNLVEEVFHVPGWFSTVIRVEEGIFRHRADAQEVVDRLNIPLEAEYARFVEAERKWFEENRTGTFEPTTYEEWVTEELFEKEESVYRVTVREIQ